jgi:phenylacetate-CoA ligase
MFDWYKLYNNSPYPLRVLAASARGYYLRWWRYGTDTEKGQRKLLNVDREF